MKEEKKSFTKEEILKLLVILVCFIGMIVFCIFTGNKRTKFTIDKNYVNIEELFSHINNNYTLNIEKQSEESIEKIEYITDGTLELYTKDNDKNGYLVYNGKTYYVESKNSKIKEVNKIPNYINDHFANIGFIKSLIKYCDNNKKNDYSFDCSIKIKDYIDNYNVSFNTSYDYEGEDNIVFTFRHGEVVYGLSVDYTRINEIINNGNTLKYNIRIDKVNSNDYSNLLNVFEKILKK